MALRLLQLFVPASESSRVREILDEACQEPSWSHPMSDDRALVQVVLEAEGSEDLLDTLEREMESDESFRMILLPVEASIPRRGSGSDDGEGGDDDGASGESPGVGRGPFLPRVSREELYADLVDTVQLSGSYVLMALLASIVAAVGILGNDTPVVIGAMVIAPLMGPNVALAFATTLADWELGSKAVKAGVVGTVLALAISAAWGLVAEVDPAMPQVAARTDLTPGDLVLALAAGSAGVLTFSASVASALVGVMVAVALLPPLVTAGLLLGSGHPDVALEAGFFFAANVIGVNLAGVVTFLAHGVQPLSWWEAGRARKAAWRAVVLWVILFAALAAIVVLR